MLPFFDLGCASAKTQRPLKVKKKPLAQIGLIQKSDYDSVYTLYVEY
jgi:hypothetical protein